MDIVNLNRHFVAANTLITFLQTFLPALNMDPKLLLQVSLLLFSERTYEYSQDKSSRFPVLKNADSKKVRELVLVNKKLQKEPYIFLGDLLEPWEPKFLNRKQHFLNCFSSF